MIIGKDFLNVNVKSIRRILLFPVLFLLFSSLFTDIGLFLYEKNHLPQTAVVYESETSVFYFAIFFCTLALMLVAIMGIIINLGWTRRWMLFWVACFFGTVATWSVIRSIRTTLYVNYPTMTLFMIFSVLNVSLTWLGIAFLQYLSPGGQILDMVLLVGIVVFNTCGITVSIRIPEVMLGCVSMSNLFIPLIMFFYGAFFFLFPNRENMQEIRRIRMLYVADALMIFVDMFGEFTGLYSDWLLAILAAFSFIIYQVFATFVEINRRILSEQEKKDLEQEKIQSKMDVLTTQMQPHFIFNSLNSIGELCVLDPQKAEEAVIHFSKYLRANISFLNGTQVVRFTEEMENVRHYFSLERIRFGGDIRLVEELEVEAFFVPLLSVEPLVENAFKHGLREKDGGGTVTVKSYEDKNQYIVEVLDDGVGFHVKETLKKKESVGLTNVIRRVELILDGRVEIESKIGVRTCVKIILPKNKNYVD